MNDERTPRRPGTGSVTALRTPFQTPAVNPTPTDCDGQRDDATEIGSLFE